MRRKDREKDKKFALDVLGGCEYAVLATVNADNTPYCIPISPVLTGEIIYFHCAGEGKKIDNIKQNSSVCLTGVRNTKLIPEKFTTEYESAVAFGKCEIVENEKEKIKALEMICEKYAKDAEGTAGQIKKYLNRTGIWKIVIEEITGKENKNTP